MRTPNQIKAEIKMAEQAIQDAFDKRDFDGAGICQDAADSLRRELRDWDDESDHYQDYIEMFEPKEKPYRELPDSPECWSMAGA